MLRKPTHYGGAELKLRNNPPFFVVVLGKPGGPDTKIDFWRFGSSRAAPCREGHAARRCSETHTPSNAPE